jgi:hypothetical protein
MFNNYQNIAVAGADESTIYHQAYLHGKLVRFFNLTVSDLDVSDVNVDYQTIKVGVENVFKNNCEVTTILSQLEALGNLKPTHDYGWSYQRKGYYTNTNVTVYDHNDIDCIKGELSRLLTNTLLQIAKKEKYIDYKLSETEETRDITIISDSIAMSNNRLNRDLGMCDLFNLKYMNEKDRPNGKGFVHQVKKVTSNIGHRGVATTPEIIVGKQWVEDVFDRGLAILEYEGTHAFTTQANKIEGDNEKTLYDIRIVQIQGDRKERLLANGERYYSNLDNKHTRKLFKVKDVVLSVSADKQHQAIGSNAMRAESTMKRRQKAAMIKSLNL